MTARFSGRQLAALALIGGLIGAWISPGRAYADPVPDAAGGAYVKVIDTRPAGPAIRVTLANDRGHAIRSAILRPCVYEDGRHCYWQADVRGNGRGTSFVVLSGRVFYVDLAWIGGAR